MGIVKGGGGGGGEGEGVEGTGGGGGGDRTVCPYSPVLLSTRIFTA